MAKCWNLSPVSFYSLLEITAELVAKNANS